MRKIYLTLLLLFTAGYLDAQGCIRITTVDPVNNRITITNSTGAMADISAYRMCSLFSYSNDISNGTTVISGDPANMPDGTAIEIEWPIDNNAADVSIYLPSGSFSDPTAMVDFMQYGGSGLGRENEAVQAGLWTAGTFVENNGAMIWVGTCADHSAGNWISSAIDELNTISFVAAPNPVDNELTLTFQNVSYDYFDITVYDLGGREVLNERMALNNQKITLQTSTWISGTYILRINQSDGTFLLKKIIKE